MAAKKKAAKKAATATTTRRVKAIADPMTKSQIIAQISDSTGLTKKDVNSVFDELTDIMEGHLKKRGAGQFTLPGLFKAVTQKKPATKARKGINPFTGQETTFAAKPARTVVKVRPLKKLKDMAQ
ncbi:MAG TPA: DNA-binding protein [Alcanivorax sp.]|jgi:nucleoid DNA-binding protein|nr:HU family DNA-binding protein [Alloalcanivorax venustensis]KXJ47105.1 MAG: DNA-binding protein [Alcanivorax sp. Nap_24]MAK23056.1 DNA-binding protein [Alcanivorax sp.]MCH9783262.1 HU family DNA-binding protein [Gammaproteobacteria bacterium]SMO62422.1 nucleoid DNA-binding protein [Alcanivorax sp. DSM 26295]MAQ33820.1 DNA-binding protein [Alcanivorax sp.]|tara:strand:- start:25706 stop:26080 length:375 start_codon:yes stop_codon:yes gene_type:complete